MDEKRYYFSSPIRLWYCASLCLRGTRSHPESTNAIPMLRSIDSTVTWYIGVSTHTHTSAINGYNICWNAHKMKSNNNKTESGQYFWNGRYTMEQVVEIWLQTSRAHAHTHIYKRVCSSSGPLLFDTRARNTSVVFCGIAINAIQAKWNRQIGRMADVYNGDGNDGRHTYDIIV